MYASDGQMFVLNSHVKSKFDDVPHDGECLAGFSVV